MTNKKNKCMSKIDKILIAIGGFQTIIMASYHFFIPFQFGWNDYLLETSPTINWALYSIHNYFCFNLLVPGLILLFLLFRKKESIQTIGVLSLILLLFWIFSALYQFIDPMPLPQRLMWLSYALPGVAMINAVIFGIPTYSLLLKRRS
jgi:hypothetical protein